MTTCSECDTLGPQKWTQRGNDALSALESISGNLGEGFCVPSLSTIPVSNLCMVGDKVMGEILKGLQMPQRRAAAFKA